MILCRLIWRSFIHLFKVSWNDHFPLKSWNIYGISLWSNYKYIAFNIFSYNITGISNEKTNELIICAILFQNATIFYRQELASLFQMQEKLKTCRNLKLIFLSRYLIARDIHLEIVSVFTCSSFHRTWYFAFLRLCPFIKLLFSESTSKLFWLFLLLKSYRHVSLQIFVCSR